jgi:hypothetical protein
MSGLAAYAVPLGVAVFVLANVGFRIRIGKAFEPYCLVAVAGVAVAGWIGSMLSVLAALGIVTAVMVLLVAYETVTNAEARHELRSQHHGHSAQHAE